MAVQPQTPYKEYTANGSTKSFALEFDCENQDHLIVLVDDMEPVVGTWSLSNGAVVFGTTPDSGKKITVQRNTPFRRDEDFQSYDNSFRPPGVNKGLDKVWLKLQELGVADWILSNRIDALKKYVDDRDDELRSYLMEEIRKQGVALDQLDEYYNYLMQQLAQVAINQGWNASFIVSADGSTQQQINDRGGAKWYEKPLGYALNDRVILANGDEVKNIIAKNTKNPNVDMTGWVKTNDASQIFDESGANQQSLNDKNKQINLSVENNLQVTTQTKDSFKNAYSTQQSNLFEQLRAMSACGRCYIWKNPLHAAQTNYRFSVGINMNGFKTAEWKFIADADNFIRMEYGYTGAIRSPTGITDAINKVGTVSGSGNNQYFTVVDSSFELPFTGVGLLVNQYVDANGGIFDVYLDGALLRTMSCNINNPENTGSVSGNVQKLVVSDLSNTTHTVKFVFKGADPLYPPTTSARGYFKNFTGADTHTAAVVSGNEMGMSASGAKLVVNGIIDFAISSRAFGTTMPYDWTPSHSGAAGAMVVHSRKMYIDNTLIDDALTVVASEKEFKEFTIIQKYTAYNSNDTAKAYPLYTGTLITKFDRKDGLSYAHESKSLNNLDVSEGFMPMLSGRRTSDLLTFETDNGQVVDISGAAPATDMQNYVGLLKSARWMGSMTGIALSIESPEASCSLGKSYADVNPTMFNQRADGFCKLYIKTMGRNSIVEAGTRFVSRHKVWLATF